MATRLRPRNDVEFGGVALGIDQYNTDDDLSVASLNRDPNTRPKR